MHELAFGVHSFAQTRYGDEGLGPASSDIPDFADSPWQASPSLRNKWGSKVGESWGEQEEGKEKK